ncbi:SDR family NAD(P)-dependent oxidoreductase [Sphingobium sp. PNB]|uniref:SDR family NAD(P)-dependent oxidoreductase n=1 Tax=Sphingobium sp. PNB TaxID=863934 RepID=UPI001CA3DAF1|nr:SDR family NAD(P)-dependent oxidoreductase [Sphingobium sp. PNB]MCB4859658.1 SDR family NAD(P)-dependent oxidoreductase [Sphingobium sp. PNB]
MAPTWFITGSSRGIGRALAEAVLAAGHNLVATARRPEQLNELVARYPAQILATALDVTDADAAASAVTMATMRFGRLDIVVNNAGYGNVAPIENTNLESFREQIEANLFGTIIVSKAVIPLFRKQGAGRFIQFSSIGGRAAAIGRGPYSAAKFGVEGFSEVLAEELRPFGVRVTIVEPGGFRTDFAGTSTMIEDGDPAYADTVGRVAERQRLYDGNQPGDPVRAAQAVLRLAQLSDPPLRLVLGSDAYERAERMDAARMAELRQWRSLSCSTDFVPVTRAET